LILSAKRARDLFAQYAGTLTQQQPLVWIPDHRDVESRIADFDTRSSRNHPADVLIAPIAQLDVVLQIADVVAASSLGSSFSTTKQSSKRWYLVGFRKGCAAGNVEIGS
jgi:hypothetical protein